MNKTLIKLNEQFSIENVVIIKEVSDTEKNSLFYIEVNNKFATAIIHLQGAHLTNWSPNNSKPVIWLSEDALFTKNKSIRGGIPICWPWFGAHPTNSDFPAHGFARTLNWEIKSIETHQSGKTQIILCLPIATMPKEQWPLESGVECKFIIGHELEIELTTFNQSQEKMIIGEALHSYFNVSDVRNILIEGLEETEYLDKLDNFNRYTQADSIEIKQEVDRIYLATDHECLIEDLGFNRRIKITKKESLSTIVWNPWETTANKMGDLGVDSYLNMVCVESGNAASDVVTIEPNQKHSLLVHYTIDKID